MRKLHSIIIVAVVLLAGCIYKADSKSTYELNRQEPEDAKTLRLTPLEYRAKVEYALSTAKTNKKEIIKAIASVPEEHIIDVASLASQTGYRYFFPSMSEQISDATTISAELLATNVKLGHEARRTFPWAKEIDDNIFRRFILPYRMTTEKLADWRTYFWKHTELRPLVDEYAQKLSPIKSAGDKSIIFREMLHRINTDWLGKNVPYAPRGMPDMNPIEAIGAKTGRCTDQTNTLIGILRAFGIAATGVRAVWWAEQNDNHTWTAVYDPYAKEWLDIDSGQTGSASDPAYFRRFIRYNEKKAAKIYWVEAGEETGAVFAALQLKDKETYPPYIEKYLIAKPMKDMTERYNDVINLEWPDVPADTLIWLAVRNSSMWKPVAGARSTADGVVTFPKVGCGIRYRLVKCGNDTLSFCSEVISITASGSIVITQADRKDNITLLEQQAIKLIESGKFKDAKDIFIRVLEFKPDDSKALYNMACILSLMKEPNEALNYLEKAVSAGWKDFEHIKKDSDLDNIRSQERFKRLIGDK